MFLAEMTKNTEGVHVGFLQQVTGKPERQQWEGTCIIEVVEIFLKEARTHTLGTYIYRRKMKVA